MSLSHASAGDAETWRGHYTSEAWASVFADWSISELCEYQAEVHEGPGHNGQPALAGLEARR